MKAKGRTTLTPKPAVVVLTIPKSKDEASKNWKALIAQTGMRVTKRRRMEESSTIESAASAKKARQDEPVKILTLNDRKFISGFPRYDAAGNIISVENCSGSKKPTWCLAMDCEMVGVGPQKESALARVSIVNEDGYCILDTFVKPKVKVTDYRTPVSGVRPEDLANAPEFSSIVKRVASLIENRIVVGHALEHDFKALLISHPKHKIRDTSQFYRQNFKPGLKYLANKHLNIDIQQGEHNSIQDAQVAMKLYLNARKDWETQIRNRRLNLPPRHSKNVLVASGPR